MLFVESICTVNAWLGLLIKPAEILLKSIGLLKRSSILVSSNVFAAIKFASIDVISPFLTNSNELTLISPPSQCSLIL